MVDANARRTTFAFDGAGRDTGSVDPLGRRVTFGYDAAGNKTLKWDPRGVRTTFVFDDAGRVTGERFPSGRRHTLVYDDVGNRTSSQDPSGTYSASFDGKNRPVVTVNADSKGVTRSKWACHGGRRVAEVAGRVSKSSSVGLRPVQGGGSQ